MSSLFKLLILSALITISSCKRSKCVSDKYAIPIEKIPNSPRPIISRNLEA